MAVCSFRAKRFRSHASYVSKTILGLLDPWRWDWWVVPKRRWLTTSLRTVISQKSQGLRLMYVTLGREMNFCLLIMHLPAWAWQRHSQSVPRICGFLVPFTCRRRRDAWPKRRVHGLFFKYWTVGQEGETPRMEVIFDVTDRCIIGALWNVQQTEVEEIKCMYFHHVFRRVRRIAKSDC